jgi:membrane fusion protein, adhesin transport system
MTKPPLIAHSDIDVPSNTRVRLTLWVAAICLIALTVWAALTEIDQVTRAPGQIIASSRTQVVQAVDGGVLRELKVQEGQTVKTGQLLATLEKARAQAAVDDSRAKVAALRITLARLRSEVYGGPLVFDEDLLAYPELIENQKNLFNRRRTAFTEDIAAQQKVRSVLSEELAMNKKLEAAGDVSKAEVLRLERQVAEIDAQITGRRNKFFQDAQTEMAKAQEDLNTQSEALNDRTQLLDQTDLIAPADGVVKNIKVTTLGGVVRSGDTVMELLPTDGSLIVEAKVQPSDVAWVRLGQQANVKLDAFDFSIFGGFKGDVVYVSPDTLNEETPQGPKPYYRVHIRIGEKEFTGARADRLEALPGMTAQVDILAMRRTVLSYIVNPVSKIFTQGLKEL